LTVAFLAIVGLAACDFTGALVGVEAGSAVHAVPVKANETTAINNLHMLISG
jgi:hypothetical protein